MQFVVISLFLQFWECFPGKLISLLLIIDRIELKFGTFFFIEYLTQLRYKDFTNVLVSDSVAPPHYCSSIEVY